MTYMLAESVDEIASEWKKYAGYTVRPVPSTVAYYESILERYGANSNSMIYGATPEIRSIYQRQNKKVLIVDRSELMVRAMGKLTYAGHELSSNETYLKKDWLEMSDYDNKFDVLIGDDAINMLVWGDFDEFLRMANRLLKNDGVFICHLLIKPDEELVRNTFAELTSEFYAGQIKSKYDLASRLNFICYNNKAYGMGWQQTIAQLGKDKLGLVLDSIDFIDVFGKCNSQFCCPPQSLFEIKARQYFEIDELFYPHEHDYCLYEPVYLLRKKVGTNDE